MKQKQNRRSGLTLTELLVVVAIIVIVTSVLAPLLTSSMEGREVREAARMVNAYFQQAQAKAKELNRPVGVMIRRTPGPTTTSVDRESDLDFGYQLTLAEEPPPYSGFTSSARATVAVLADGQPAQATADDGSKVGIASIADGPAFRKLVAPNDFIRFNFRGPKYRISEVGNFDTDTGTYVVQFQLEGAQKVRYSKSNSMKFEVFRRPRSISSTPLELPTGSGIVMNLSGVGTFYDKEFATAGEEMSESNSPRQKYIGLTEFQRHEMGRFRNMPLTILFNPSGGVERIYRVLAPLGSGHLKGYAKLPPKRPQDKIYLFVGKQGLTRAENIADGSNLWIAIDPQTGSVTTAPNAINTDAGLQGVATSRELAATGQSMGGQ